MEVAKLVKAKKEQAKMPPQTHEHSQERIRELQTLRDNLNSEKTNLEQQIQGLQSELAAASATIQDIQKKLVVRQSANQELQAQLAEARTREETLQAQLNELQTQFHALKTTAAVDLQKSQEATEQLQQQVTLLSAERDDNAPKVLHNLLKVLSQHQYCRLPRHHHLLLMMRHYKKMNV